MVPTALMALSVAAHASDTDEYCTGGRAQESEEVALLAGMRTEEQYFSVPQGSRARQAH